jgi:two-component system sensor histidine kinase CpxA
VEHLAVLLLVVTLCYGLAYRLTTPLRNLEQAVDRFGRGQLEARAVEKRHDELGELAAAFNRMAGHVQTLMAAERRLLLDISHELRSPLTRLSVAVELARSSGGTSPALDRIEKEADRLNALINQLLEVTRAEIDPSQIRTASVRLDQLVSTTVEDCAIEAAVRQCSLDFPPPPIVELEGDGELLRRAVENVLRNAIRHAPPDSNVEVRLETAGELARIRIRDHGPGVPQSALPRLFDPFYRVESDRDRSSGGAGLGLAIAKRAIEVHRGALSASNTGEGLLVEIELPVRNSVQSKIAAVPPPLSEPAPGHHRG